MIDAIVDTGSLVAVLNSRESHHLWAIDQLDSMRLPLLTCEPVITEVLFLLSHSSIAVQGLWRLIQDGEIVIPFSLNDEREAIQKLMMKYADQPMSLADACLVWMSELFPEHFLFTLDSDFKTYRRFGRRVIPLITP